MFEHIIGGAVFERLNGRVFTDDEKVQLEAVPVITGAAYEGGERPSIRGLVVDEATPGTCPPGGR